MRRVKFSVQQYSKRRNETYEQGSTHSMSDDRARFYVQRGTAEYLDGSKQKPDSAVAASESTSQTASTITAMDYDRAVEAITAGEFDLDYAVNGMSAHFSVDASVIRKELETRIEEKKKPDATTAGKKDGDTRSVTSNANEAAARGNDVASGTVERPATSSDIAAHPDQSKGSTDGNTVASSADVAGQNSGSTGQRSEHVGGRGRGGTRGGNTGSGNK